MWEDLKEYFHYIHKDIPNKELYWGNLEKADRELLIAQLKIKKIEKDVEEYITLRKAEYPSAQDQLDTLYHSGIEGWKASIKLIKDKYPKPE